MTPTIDDATWWLTNIRINTPLLHIAQHTRPTTDAPNPNGPASTTPLNLHIAHLLDTTHHHPIEMHYCDPRTIGINPYLNGWIRDIQADITDTHGPNHAPTPTTTDTDTACTWLTTWLPFTATQHYWPDFTDGIRYLHATIAGAIAHLHTTTTTPITCGTCHTGTLHQTSPNEWHCTNPDCTRPHITIRAVTLPQAARLTGGSLRTIQHWAQRGRFTRVEDNASHALYDLGQISAAVTELRLIRTLETRNTPGPKPRNTTTPHP